MSAARRALIDLLYGERPTALGAAYEVGEHPEREKDADAVLALHAHELAEKIRAAEWAEPCSEGCCNGDGPETIADFIDPEVG